MRFLSLRTLRLFLIVLLVPKICWAGQMHYEDIMLSQVQLTLLVQYLAETKAGSKIRVKVLKIWRRVNDQAGMPNISQKLAEGQEVEISLLKDAPWEDEHESPISRRYWDVIREKPKPGEKLLLAAIGGEMFEPSSYTMEKAEKFERMMDVEKSNKWLKAKNTRELIQLYGDLDLRDQAIQEARSRGTSVVEFLRATQEERSFVGLLHHFYYRDEKEKPKVLDNMRELARRESDFSKDQLLWTLRWFNSTLFDPQAMDVRFDLVQALLMKEASVRKKNVSHAEGGPLSEEVLEAVKVAQSRMSDALDDAEKRKAFTPSVILKFADSLVSVWVRRPDELESGQGLGLIPKVYPLLPASVFRFPKTPTNFRSAGACQ